MSVITYMEKPKNIIAHISQSGWEIDKYSDGTWDGYIEQSQTVTMTPQNTALSGNIKVWRGGLALPASPAGLTKTQLKNIFLRQYDIYPAGLIGSPWLAASGNVQAIVSSTATTGTASIWVCFAYAGTWT